MLNLVKHCIFTTKYSRLRKQLSTNLKTKPNENMMYVNLPDGTKMPALGYGTCFINNEELEKIVDAALEAGYRHFDTATLYDNEKPIGNVIKRWLTSGKIKREDLFLVTKLPGEGLHADVVPKFIQQSLEYLQVDYLDLYLIHTPIGLNKDTPKTPEGAFIVDSNTDIIGVWKAMEEQVKEGKVKAIGLSNFNINQIKRIIAITKIPIANLQIELHAYFQQKELVEFCKENNITITAYSPLGNPGYGKILELFGQKDEQPNELANPAVKMIAEKYKKSPAQVLLRHIVQKGIAAIPKSTNPERVRQNMDIFDFELDAEDMSALDRLDKGPEARKVDFKFLSGFEDHPEYPFSKD